MRVQEVAKKYGVSRQAVYLWMSRGMPYETKFLGIRSYRVMDEKKVDEWVKAVRGVSG